MQLSKTQKSIITQIQNGNNTHTLLSEALCTISENSLKYNIGRLRNLNVIKDYRDLVDARIKIFTIPDYCRTT